MAIYHQLNKNNHPIDLMAFEAAIAPNIYWEANNPHIVPHGFGKRIDTPTDTINKDNHTIADFALDMIDLMTPASFPTRNLTIADGKVKKEPLPYYTNCSVRNNYRHKDSAIEIGIIFIDLDEGTNTQAIFNNLLANYKYIAWTTASHLHNGNGARLRIALFLEKPHDPIDFEDYSESVTNWINESAIGDEYWLDKSCTVVSQAAIPPLYNQHVGTIDIWTNIGPGTTCFDLTSLTPIAAPPKAPKAPTGSQTTVQATGVASTPLGSPAGAAEGLSAMDKRFIAECKTNPVWRQEIVDMVLKTTWLTHSSYQSRGTDQNGNHDPTLTLSSMCCAIQLIGCAQTQWDDIYKHMTSGLTVPTSNTAAETWKKQWNREDKLIISIKKLMNLHHKKKFGLLAEPLDYAAYRAERIEAETVTDTKEVEYLSVEDLTSPAKVTIVIGDTGIGKTTAVKGITSANVRIAVPTQLIRDQQSDESIQTYDSVHKIKFEDDTKPEWFVLDEAHNLPSMSFRAAAEIKLYDHIRDMGMQYSKVIILSATLDTAMAMRISLINSGVMGMDDIEIIKRTKLNGPKKYYRVVEKETDGYKYTQILLQQVLDEIAKNRLVYVVNDNGAANEAVASALNKMAIPTMSVSRTRITNNKATEFTDFDRNLHDFVTTDDFEMGAHGLKVIITTQLGCEGVNVCDEVDAVSLIVVGDLNPTHIRQSSGRFRRAKVIDMVHIQSDKRKKVDTEKYIAARKLAFDNRLSASKYWLATNPEPTYKEWLKHASSSVKAESEWAKAYIEDGVWFDKEKLELRDVRELAEITLQADVDKAKFYNDQVCQEIYMECAGFIIGERVSGDYICDQVIYIMDEVGEALSEERKSTKAAKISKFTEGLTKMFDKLDGKPIPPSAYAGIAKLLGVDTSIVIKIDNLVRQDEKTKWMVDAAVNCWNCDEIAWRYVSDSSDIVRAIGKKYPAGEFLTPIDCGEVAQDILHEQIKRMGAMGVTDIAARLSAKSSIWDSCRKKIDFASGKVIDKKGFSQWLGRNGFLNLEKHKPRVKGKQVEGYLVV